MSSAGRKKHGNLGEPWGIRFDQPVEELLLGLVAKTPMAKDNLPEVVRVITTWWLMNNADAEKAFERIAKEVHSLRATFARGVENGARVGAHLTSRRGKRSAGRKGSERGR